MNAKWHSVAWSILTTLHWSDQTMTLLTNSTFYRIIRGFNRTFATDVACQHETLTSLDTWSCPIWDLHKFYFLRPILSLNLSLFCSGLCSLIIPRYFLDFASYSNYMMWKIISTCNTANRHLIFIVAEMIFILYMTFWMSIMNDAPHCNLEMLK